MEIVYDYTNCPKQLRGAAVAVGNFDGMHRGHLAVVGEAGRIARANKLPWLAMTFEPHPRELFRPNGPSYRLTPFHSKVRMIEALGVDGLIVPKFDRAFSRLSAQDFIDRILVEGVGARHVISGYDFFFGRDRRGNCELLLKSGRTAGFDFTVVSAVRENGGEGEVYSSSRARKAIAAGDMRAAAGILSRPYEISGTVVPGDRRGRTIGVPTANIDMSEFMRPRYGVYAVLAATVEETADGPRWMPGVANVGNRPTVDGGREFLEAHLFDGEADLYGKELRVKFIAFIRPETRFDGMDALKRRISEDIKKAKELLANYPSSV